MPPPDALIRRAAFHAVAPDAESALLVLHAAEAVLHRAVEAAAASLGDEVLVLRRVDLRFLVELDGRSTLTEAQMERALRGAIVRSIARARETSSRPVITEQAAWFPSEASAIAELLAAHVGGRAAAWPYRSLTAWGATPVDVLRACLARGRLLLGDVLAHAIRALDAGGLLAAVPDELAAAIVATWTEGDAERALAVSALPPDLRAAVATEVARLGLGSEVRRDFIALARLLALWPPARELRIPLVEIRLLAGGLSPGEAARATGAAQTPASGETSPDVAGETSPDAAGETSPDAAGETSPDAAGETSLDAAGETSLDAAGETSLDAAAGETSAPAEALAELLRGAGLEALIARMPEGVAARLVALLRRPPEGRAAALASVWTRLEKAGIPTAELRRAIEGVTVKRLISAAGGLLAWAALFEAEGLAGELAEAYPEQRTLRAVRWAVGRALEDARIGGADPALLLWAGEDRGALVEPARTLADADAEPLHRRAVRLLAARGRFTAPLVAARFGDFVTLSSGGDGGLCVDAILGDDVHDAVPELVRRFAARAGVPPPGIEVAERLRGDAADALVEVDVPPLPEPWRVAVRAFASLARSVLVERWRAPVRDLRGWPAIVELGQGIAVEILRSDATRVAGGGWLKESTHVGGRGVTIRPQ